MLLRFVSGYWVNIVGNEKRADNGIIDAGVVVEFTPALPDRLARIIVRSEVASPGEEHEFLYDYSQHYGWRLIPSDSYDGEPIFHPRRTYSIRQFNPGPVHPRERWRLRTLPL